MLPSELSFAITLVKRQASQLTYVPQTERSTSRDGLASTKHCPLHPLRNRSTVVLHPLSAQRALRAGCVSTLVSRAVRVHSSFAARIFGQDDDMVGARSDLFGLPQQRMQTQHVR